MEIEQFTHLLIDSYAQTLKYNDTSPHVVLYSTNRAYEYDPISFKFRPFNSVLWLSLNKNDFFSFYSYIKNKYYKIKEHHSIGKCKISEFASISGTILSIDLDRLLFFVKNSTTLNVSKQMISKESIYDETVILQKILNNEYIKAENNLLNLVKENKI